MKEAAESKRIYEEKMRLAETKQAELQNADLKLRKESNRNKLVRDLRDLLEKQVQNHSVLHQNNIEYLQKLQKNVSDKKIEEFKEVKLSELKAKQDRELVELQEKHKQQRDALVAFLQAQCERGQSDLPNPLYDQLGTEFAMFLSVIELERQIELDEVRQKFSSDLQAAEEKIKQMIHEVTREPLVDM